MTTDLDRKWAREFALLFGGNGLSQDRQIELVASEIAAMRATEPAHGSLNRYQADALRTALPNVTQEHDLLHAVFGVISEGGELADALKRQHAYGKPVDAVNLREELGDVLWYLALACRGLGTTLDEVASLNIAKLRTRYPEKFTMEAALNRDLAAERAVLEGKSA